MPSSLSFFLHLFLIPFSMKTNLLLKVYGVLEWLQQESSTPSKLYQSMSAAFFYFYGKNHPCSLTKNIFSVDVMQMFNKLMQHSIRIITILNNIFQQKQLKYLMDFNLEINIGKMHFHIFQCLILKMINNSQFCYILKIFK